MCQLGVRNVGLTKYEDDRQLKSPDGIDETLPSPHGNRQTPNNSHLRANKAVRPFKGVSSETDDLASSKTLEKDAQSLRRNFGH